MAPYFYMIVFFIICEEIVERLGSRLHRLYSWYSITVKRPKRKANTMKKAELDNLIANGKTLDDLIYDFELNNDEIVSRDIILDFAINQIQNDRLFLARHVLDAVDKEYADFYSYDMSMGTLEMPTAITSIEDLYDFVD